MESQKLVTKTSMKVTLLGDGAVGKTTLVKSYMDSLTSDRKYKATLGAEIAMKKIQIRLENKLVEVNLQLWDLAGQPSFSNIRKTFYMGSVGAILVYDIGRIETIQNINKWLEDLNSVMPRKIPVVLVGNKKDLREKGMGMLSTDLGKQKAAEITKITGLETPFVEASAIRSENADAPFERLVELIYHTFHLS